MSVISGKNALITGGANGIGLEIAKSLLKNGLNNLAILDIQNSNYVNDLQLNYPSKKILFFKTDVGDRDNVRQSFQQTIDAFKQLDIVVANAGICNERDYEKTIQINLLGVMHTNYTAIEFMSRENNGQGGLIANMASVCGLSANIFSIPAYTASKHGVIGLTRSFSNDFYFNKSGIKFIAICPGFTDTTLIGDIDKKIISLDAKEKTDEFVKSQMLQTPEMLGSCFIDILKTNQNSGIWIVDGGCFEEVKITKYWPKS